MVIMNIVNIKKSYKKKSVLNNITLSVEEGSCVGILGGNGSGKSTLLSVLAGVLKPDGGSVDWMGQDLLHNKELRTQVLGYVPQGNPLLEELTAWDNLLLWYDKNTLKQELEGGVLAMLGIPEFIKVPVNKMSGGMKKRLSIGCVVAANPKVLLLDEPSAALDLVCKERIYNYLKDYKEQGGRILLATHDVQELDLCDKWYILKDGFLTPYEYDGNVHRLVGKL
ncbi:MAG: ABC transporter ATP-binding protein [Lachnospiraceae bacterium]|nr:ABC transporter ATP-binding protein [Lachnospiraceae bacterium]